MTMKTPFKDHHIEGDSPLLITQKGDTDVVLPNDEYQRESLALLKLLVLSDKAAKGNALSIEQVFAD